MSVTLEGKRELEARLKAIGDTSQLLREFAPVGIREIKLETPRRTGNLSRLNQIAGISRNEIRFTNIANYAVPVHEGSRAHDIRPVRRKALRWPADRASARLTGSPRKGGNVIFAKRARHPGTKPNPFMLRGLEKALRLFGFGDAVIRVWNRAA